MSSVIEQLAGVRLPASAWESLILPARVGDYSPTMLDELVVVAKLREQVHHVVAGVRIIRHEGIQLGVLGYLFISRRGVCAGYN